MSPDGIFGAVLRFEMKKGEFIFCARWLVSIPFEKAWRRNSQISHYVSDKPESPYIIQKDPITANDRTTEDGYVFHWLDTHVWGMDIA